MDTTVTALSSLNLWLMIGMFILLVITTWMGPGKKTRAFLLVVGAAFLTFIAYAMQAMITAIGMGVVLGFLLFFWLDVCFGAREFSE